MPKRYYKVKTTDAIEGDTFNYALLKHMVFKSIIPFEVNLLNRFIKIVLRNGLE